VPEQHHDPGMKKGTKDDAGEAMLTRNWPPKHADHFFDTMMDSDFADLRAIQCCLWRALE
jgi:hypothetical protein